MDPQLLLRCLCVTQDFLVGVSIHYFFPCLPEQSYSRRFLHSTPTTSFASSPTSNNSFKVLIKVSALAQWLKFQTAKSFVIADALVSGSVSVDEATDAARAETLFQLTRFAEVEWAHPLEESDTKARLASAAVFARLCASIEP